ncbi:hypothetical protein C4D60_Mb10t27010 [Musa balbisiana]|uniref:Delta(3)-Delta(2)-enoyl-CoA isomerase n=1 Tax=Musa balbisiana TaxID=52838 RepID=A0A4S8J016_MUSBA|nr:hypothetical protein C4D60_Mb10t27010 [Musa balbisiana]
MEVGFVDLTFQQTPFPDSASAVSCADWLLPSRRLAHIHCVGATRFEYITLAATSTVFVIRDHSRDHSYVVMAEMCRVEKRGRVYLLTLAGTDEHRLNPALLDSIRSAIAGVRSDAAASGGSAALVVAAEGKFFSNGFDLAWARVSPSDRAPLMVPALQRTIADLLSLPMPTIAAVTGHAAAAGCFLALSHDYVVMRADRGFLYMSEIDIGLPITENIMAVLRAKIADPRTRRDLLLRGKRMTASEAAARGIVDRAVEGAAETVEAAVAMGEELAARNWDGEVYASIRKGAFHEACRGIGVAVEDEEAEMKKVASKL